MRMDVFEMRILYEDVIRDILFYFLFFFFFFFPFLILSPSLLLSARRCGVSAQRDHPSIKRVWAACGGFFPLIFYRWDFFLQVGLFSSSLQASVAVHEHIVPQVIPNNTEKSPNFLSWHVSHLEKQMQVCVKFHFTKKCCKSIHNSYIMQTFNKL